MRTGSVSNSLTRSAVSIAIRLFIGFALLTAAAWSIDFRELVDNFSFSSLKPEFLVLFPVFAVADRALMAYKWNLLLRVGDISISTWQATRLYYIGHMIGSFTPGAIGGDAYRVTALSEFKKTKMVISTILLERLLGLAVVGIFAAIGLPISLRYLSGETSWMVWTSIGGGGLGVLAVFFTLHPPAMRKISRPFAHLINTRILQKLTNFYSTYAENRQHWPTLLAFTFLTALEVILTVGISYLAAASLGIVVSFGYFLGVMPLLFILLRLPITFQGIGVQEGLFAFFLVAAGHSAADGFSISLFLRVAEVGLGFIPATIMMWLGSFKVRPTSADL